MANDRADHWGSAEWAQAQDTPKGRLEAELIEEIRGSQTAVHQMDEAAHRAMGINATDGRCLDIIDRRGLISAGQLATEAGLTTGAVTAVLDRLEAKDLVRRQRCPKDRRQHLCWITPKGQAVLQKLDEVSVGHDGVALGSGERGVRREHGERRRRPQRRMLLEVYKPQILAMGDFWSSFPIRLLWAIR